MQSRTCLGRAAGAALLVSIKLSAGPLLGGPALAQDGSVPAASIVHLPGGAGRARLTLPDDRDTPAAIVVVLPDGRPRDARAEPYLAGLRRAGFGVLELGHDGRDQDVAQLAANLDAAGQALRAQPGLAHVPMMALGFGAGAEAALSHAGRLPVAALYPDCTGLAARPDPASGPHAAPLLLLLAGDAPVAAAPGGAAVPCARRHWARLWARLWGGLAETHLYHAVEAGWDVPARPDLGVRAARRPDITADAALRVASFFAGQIAAAATADPDLAAVEAAAVPPG